MYATKLKRMPVYTAKERSIKTYMRTVLFPLMHFFVVKSDAKYCGQRVLSVCMFIPLHILTRKQTALDRRRTDRISLTHDLDL